MAYPPPPYVDAVTGTPLAGEAIVGTWWAYPPQPGLVLGGYSPEITALSGNVPPPAGLLLVGWVPSATVVQDRTAVVTPAGLSLGGVVPALPDPDVQPLPAGLVLGAVAPALAISLQIAVLPAGLLLGGTPPEFVGMLRLIPVVCIDTDLIASLEQEAALVAMGVGVTAFSPVVARQLALSDAGERAISLDPLECG